MLDIRNLHVVLEDGQKQVIRGLDLQVEAGQLAVIMGPNGSGKSTLSYTLAGKPGYEVTAGSAHLDDVDLLALAPDARSLQGLFLAFQYPVEIPGIGNMTFLRTAVNAHRVAQGQQELSAADFLKRVREEAKKLGIKPDILSRALNSGFSGGEKKRNEVLQMLMLEPRLCILDETDSGLDVDAMRFVTQGINTLRDEKRGFLVITHYHRLLEGLEPDIIYVMSEGRVIHKGGVELALEIEKNGYKNLLSGMENA